MEIEEHETHQNTDHDPKKREERLWWLVLVAVIVGIVFGALVMHQLDMTRIAKDPGAFSFRAKSI